MATAELKPGPSPSNLELLERRESELWKISLLLLALLAAGLALSSWGTLSQLPWRLEALPIGAVVLVLLFAAYVWSKKREIAELRGFIRGLRERTEAPPTEQQLQQLVEILSRSQSGYRDLIDSLDQVVFTFSLKGEAQVVNRRFADILGLPIREVIGRPLDEFIVEPTRAAAENALERFLEKRFWSGSLRVRLKSGEVRYLDCVLHAVLKEGRVAGISGLARDITQQREAELRFTQLFETFQEGVYFSTPEGQILDANPTLVHMLGYDSKEALLEINAKTLYPDPAQRRVLLSELETQGVIHDRQITLRRKDSSLIQCLDSAAVTRDGAGRIVRLQGTLVDITGRLEMEKRLHQDREFAHRLVESCPDAIVVLDTQRRYTFVSWRIRELLGYKPEDLLGRRMGERAHPEDETALEQAFDALISGKTPILHIDYRTRHKDGGWRLLRASACPLLDAEGKITGLVASARDVTDQKRMEQQLLQAEKLAAMGQMIAGVAHELNNPLAAILGTSEFLRENLTEETTHRQIELLHQQARRAAHIVESLLSFSGPAKLVRARVDVVQLLERTLQLQDQALRAQNISVEVAAEPDLPPVAGDPNRLMQVFVNLLTNAEQAIREVRKSGRIHVRCGRSDGHVFVTFQDDGPGIPAEILPRVFDPFFTTKRPGRGTGLGLSICLAIAREHGGTIEAQTPSEGGARFTLSLPVGDVGQPSRNDLAVESAPV